MIKYFFIIIAVAVVAAGCGKISDDNGDWRGGWIIVQSPLSKACYEAYDAGILNQRVFSLGKEVKCPPSDQLK